VNSCGGSLADSPVDDHVGTRGDRPRTGGRRAARGPGCPRGWCTTVRSHSSTDHRPRRCQVVRLSKDMNARFAAVLSPMCTTGQPRLGGCRPNDTGGIPFVVTCCATRCARAEVAESPSGSYVETSGDHFALARRRLLVAARGSRATTTCSPDRISAPRQETSCPLGSDAKLASAPPPSDRHEWCAPRRGSDSSHVRGRRLRWALDLVPTSASDPAFRTHGVLHLPGLNAIPGRRSRAGRCARRASDGRRLQEFEPRGNPRTASRPCQAESIRTVDTTPRRGRH
jgi:hypothetical protein